MFKIPAFLSKRLYFLGKIYCAFFLVLTFALSNFVSFPDHFDSTIAQANTYNYTAKVSSVSMPQPPKNLFLSIPKIGLNQVNLVYGSNRNISTINQLLYNDPVVENQDAVSPCFDSGNSYIYGHSEPPDINNPGKAGRIFGNLDELSKGDIIELANAENNQCRYKVDKWDEIVADSNNHINIDEYYRAMNYPEKITKSSLTIQTCKKGSTSVRLLLRASRID